MPQLSPAQVHPRLRRDEVEGGRDVCWGRVFLVLLRHIHRALESAAADSGSLMTFAGPPGLPGPCKFDVWFLVLDTWWGSKFGICAGPPREVEACSWILSRGSVGP